MPSGKIEFKRGASGQGGVALEDWNDAILFRPKPKKKIEKQKPKRVEILRPLLKPLF